MISWCSPSNLPRAFGDKLIVTCSFGRAIFRMSGSIFNFLTCWSVEKIKNAGLQSCTFCYHGILLNSGWKVGFSEDDRGWDVLPVVSKTTTSAKMLYLSWKWMKINLIVTQNIPRTNTYTILWYYIPHNTENKATLSKIAIIDIDNTLWQFSDAFYLELKKINRNFPTPDQWCTYDIWEG